jgi:hypothetical protein
MALFLEKTKNRKYVDAESFFEEHLPLAYKDYQDCQ